MDDSADSDPNSPAEKRDVIFRDDRTDVPNLLDVVKDRAAEGGRVIFVDTGKLGLSQLEWLGDGGVLIYTSDSASRDAGEFILMAKAARKAGRSVAYFHHGPFDAGDRPKAISFADLLEMARSGIHTYVSDGRVGRDPAALEELAFAAREGRARFVFYRHRSLDPGLEGLFGQGTWMHLSGAALATEADLLFLRDGLRKAGEADGGILLHVEHVPRLDWLTELFDAGAFLLFRTPPSDYRDPVRALERRAKGRIPDPTTYYLHREFLL
jgi:hypothetical protein